MASKLQFVSELANQTAHTVTRDIDGWKRYLTTASRLYKYPFDDQLMIYAQRPDATACASMELWNDTMRRWVKPRSKGIALIRKNAGGRPQLEYVFDVADTRPVKGARTPYLWEMRTEHHAAVAEALEQQYGPSEEPDFGYQLMEQASRAVKEVYREHLDDLAYDVKDSLLEELDNLNLEVRFRNLLTASVQYTLLTRCGLDPADYLEDEDLSGIVEFSTPAVLHHLGSAASEVSMNLLNEIGRAVRTYDREQAKNNQKISEKPRILRSFFPEKKQNPVGCEAAEQNRYRNPAVPSGPGGGCKRWNCWCCTLPSAAGGFPGLLPDRVRFSQNIPQSDLTLRTIGKENPCFPSGGRCCQKSAAD